MKGVEIDNLYMEKPLILGNGSYLNCPDRVSRTGVLEKSGAGKFSKEDTLGHGRTVSTIPARFVPLAQTGPELLCARTIVLGIILCYSHIYQRSTGRYEKAMESEEISLPFCLQKGREALL